MKTWLIVLPFVVLPGVCLSGAVLAEEMPEPADGKAVTEEAAAAPTPTEFSKKGLPGPHEAMSGHAPARLPHGDIRHCLGEKSYIDVIRCSERLNGK